MEFFRSLELMGPVGTIPGCSPIPANDSRRWRVGAKAIMGLAARWAKPLLFAALALPFLVEIGVIILDPLAAQPAKDLLGPTGEWSMWLLVAVMAIRPLQQIFSIGFLLRYRRMFGLFAAFYAGFHTLAYLATVDYKWGFVLTEITSRQFLFIGTLAMLLMLPLVATSTDAMVRRLGGRNWRRVQSLVYVIVVAGVVHYILSVRFNNPYDSVIQAGILGWLLHLRLVVRWRRKKRAQPLIPISALVWLSIFWTVATAFIELLFFRLRTQVPMERILNALWSFSQGLRPAHIVFLVAAALIATKILRTRRIG